MNITSKILIVGVAACSFAAAGLCDEAKKDDKLDLSTPKKAYKEFLKNAIKGDLGKLKKCVSAAPKGVKDLQEKLIKFTAVSYSFFYRMKETYGDEFEKALPKGAFGKMPKIDDIDKLECEIDGDSATLTAKDSDQQTPPIKLKKVDGKWKIALFPDDVPDPQMISLLTAIMDQSIKMFEKGHKLIGKKGETAKSIIEAMTPKSEKSEDAMPGENDIPGDDDASDNDSDNTEPNPGI